MLSIQRSRCLYVCVMLFCALISNANIQALAEETPRLSIYSHSAIEENESNQVSSIIMQAWKEVVEKEKNDFEIENEKTRFRIKLGKLDKIPFLQLTDLQSQKTYYHFISDQPLHKNLKSQLDLNNISPIKLAVNTEETLDDLQTLTRISSEYAGTDVEKYWEINNLKTMDEVNFLYFKMVNKYKEHRADYRKLSDEEYLKEYILKNQLNFKHALGDAEVNAIDGKVFIRVVHNRTELSWMFLNKNEIDLTSEHAVQYLARQHIAAGGSRLDGQFGRDVMLFHVDEMTPYLNAEELIDPSRYDELLRPEKGTPEYRRTYWKAIWKKPTLHHVSFGVFCGLLQGTTAFLTGTFIDTFINDINVMAPAILTTVWGSVFGTISSSFKNWVTIGPKRNQIIKNMANGILYQIVLTGLLDGLTGVNPFSVHGMINFATIMTASFISNSAKPNWAQITTVKEKVGKYKGEIKVGPLKWSKPNFFFQMYYIAFPNLFRFTERTNFGLPRTMPLGQVVLASSVILSQFYALKVAKKYASSHPAAQDIYAKLDIQWRFTKKLFKSPVFADQVLSYALIPSSIFGYKIKPLAAIKEHRKKLLQANYPMFYELDKVMDERVSKSRDFELPKDKCPQKMINLLRAM